MDFLSQIQNHINLGATIVILWAANKFVNRVNTVLKDYPPHRHYPPHGSQFDHIEYPYDFPPTSSKNTNGQSKGNHA